MRVFREGVAASRVFISHFGHESGIAGDGVLHDLNASIGEEDAPFAGRRVAVAGFSLAELVALIRVHAVHV